MLLKNISKSASSSSYSYSMLLALPGPPAAAPAVFGYFLVYLLVQTREGTGAASSVLSTPRWFGVSFGRAAPASNALRKPRWFDASFGRAASNARRKPRWRWLKPLTAEAPRHLLSRPSTRRLLLCPLNAAHSCPQPVGYPIYLHKQCIPGY